MVPRLSIQERFSWEESDAALLSFTPPFLKISISGLLSFPLPYCPSVQDTDQLKGYFFQVLCFVNTHPPWLGSCWFLYLDPLLTFDCNFLSWNTTHLHTAWCLQMEVISFALLFIVHITFMHVLWKSVHFQDLFSLLDHKVHQRWDLVLFIWLMFRRWSPGNFPATGEQVKINTGCFLARGIIAQQLSWVV